MPPPPPRSRRCSRRSADPARSAVLLDVDGVLAPIVAQADDAHVPETTRRPLIEIASAYGLVACVTGRRASDARRIVSLGSIAYVGNHGAEILRAGAIAPELDPELRRGRGACTTSARGVRRGAQRLRVRLEDKEAIAAFHWRGAPDEEAAEAAIRAVAERAEAAGFATHWGRKVLEIRPPVRIDKGAGIVGLLRDADLDAAIYVGDDTDRPRRVPRAPRAGRGGRLGTALRVGVRSDEGPPELEAEADVDGRRHRRRARAAQGPARLSRVRFVDFLKATVLLSAGAATVLAA